MLSRGEWLCQFLDKFCSFNHIRTEKIHEVLDESVYSDDSDEFLGVMQLTEHPSLDDRPDIGQQSSVAHGIL